MKAPSNPLFSNDLNEYEQYLVFLGYMEAVHEDMCKKSGDNRMSHRIDQLLMADDVMRVIYLADEYDPFFESDDLISKMKETKRNYYKIDLILEREFGYSTIWIDR